jgi:lipopolysaccharide export system protein LptC
MTSIVELSTDHRKRWFILILCLGALASGLLLYVIERPSGLIEATKLHTPDFYANGVTSIHFDAEGNLNSRIYSPALRNYQKSDLTLFNNPHIVLYTKNQQPWDITAALGKATHDFNHLELINHVRIHQPRGKENNEVTITTSSLTINSQAQTAYTDQPVTLIQKGNDHTLTLIKAVGVWVNQKTGEVKLLSRARGYYVPAKQ